MKHNPFLLILTCLVCVVNAVAQDVRPRVVIMTDAETDDRCSMVHALLYANDMEIKAIVQSNSCFQRHGWSSEPWLKEMIDAYGAVLPNLQVHDARYPSAEYLHSVSVVGDEDASHILDIGKSYKLVFTGEPSMIEPADWPDTPGSDRIVELLLEDDERPLIIQCWGGGNTAAKAFEKLKRVYPAQYDRAIAKAVLYCIWYQDPAGSYIEQHHPGATLLLNHHFSGSWDYGTMTNTMHFVNEEMRRDDNPLGMLYSQPYISEGDTPAFLYCVGGAGLRSWEDPSYGGWGGRFYRVEGLDNVWRDTGYGEIREWMEHAMHDFQARLQWCVTPDYNKANHAPVITLDGPADITVKSGELVKLTAHVEDKDSIDLEALWTLRGAMWAQKGSTKEMLLSDPSRFVDQWRTGWSQLPAGTYRGYVNLMFSDKNADCSFVAPKVDSPQTIHILLEAFDTAAVPRLTAYQRFIVTVEP